MVCQATKGTMVCLVWRVPQDPAVSLDPGVTRVRTGCQGCRDRRVPQEGMVCREHGVREVGTTRNFWVIPLMIIVNYAYFVLITLTMFLLLSFYV